MLLSEILFEIDTEIDRLTRARNILATLSIPDYDFTQESVKPMPAPASPVAPAPAVSEVQETAVPLTIVRAKTRTEPRVRRPRAKAQMERAIGGTIPQGPVVVSAEQVARAHAEKVHVVAVSQASAPPAPPQDGTLEALLRQLGNPISRA